MAQTKKEMKLKQEIKAWKETAEVLADKKLMKSIERSLKQIAQGKGILLEA